MEKIEVFEILKPQGIKGELKLRKLIDSITQIEDIDNFFIEDKEVSISSIRENGEFVYIKFNEIESISEAEKYRDKYVSVDKLDLEKILDEGEYFLSDLIGKKIVFESGELLGEITDIQNFGSADVFYVLKTNGKETLFSNVKGVIIDVANDKVIINKEKFGEVSV